MNTPKSQMIDRLVRMSRIGLMIGSVMSTNTRQGRAPSTSAASRGHRGPGPAPRRGDRDEGQCAPDDQQADHAELRERRRVPVVLEVVADMQLRQDVVDDTVLEVRHPVPDLNGDDDRHRPDEDEPRAQQHAHGRADPHEQKREQPSRSSSSCRRCSGEDDRPERACARRPRRAGPSGSCRGRSRYRCAGSARTVRTAGSRA